MTGRGKRHLFAAVAFAWLAATGNAAETTHGEARAGASASAAMAAAGAIAPSAVALPAPELVRRPVFSAAGTVEVGSRVIRLAGIAATAPDLQCGEGAAVWPCGRMARTAVQGFVRGRTLECRGEYCALGGRDVGAWIVSQGWAAADGPGYAAAEKTARDEKRGIWSPVRTGAIPSALTGGDAKLTDDAVLRAEVELSTQNMTVTYRGAVIGEWPVSTARDGKETPTGVWTAKWLSRDHRSRLYDDAPMPWSIFFEGDYAIHGTNQTRRLGQPASHGCVRLSPKNAKLLFSLAAKEGVDNTLIVIRP